MNEKIIVIAIFLALALTTTQPLIADSASLGTEDPLAGEQVLGREGLIRAVLDRNPEIESARQAWLAMQEVRAQVESLDDPMLGASVAPLSVFSSDVRFGATVEYAQVIPWPGKRAVRGSVANSNARAMFEEYEMVRLELATMVSDLYDEYWSNERAIEINRHHRALLEDLKGSAESRYIVGEASQQDPLEAEATIADLMKQEAILSSRRRILAAEINSLLHRDPLIALPPIDLAVSVPKVPSVSAEELIAIAFDTRPELRRIDAAIESATISIELAGLEFKPDLKVMGQYSSMWRETEHQWMAGVSINLPIRRGKLNAAVREAEAKLAELVAKRSRAEDRVRLDVVRSMEDVARASQVVEILRDRLVPASRDQVEAARAGFETGRNPFTSLVLAENRLRDASLEYEMAVADLYRSLAQLSRATGRIPFLEDVAAGGNQS